MNDIPTTCGCFLIYNGQMLIVHSTNHKWDQWGIPKGLHDEGEMHDDAMFREVHEETNIVIADYQHYLFDIGYEFYIRQRKALHAYVVILQEWDYPPIFCASTFTRNDIIQPEVDAFVWLPLQKALSMVQSEQVILFERNYNDIRRHL